MNAQTLGVAIPTLTALLIALGALYKQRMEAKKLPASLASMETTDALAAMSRYNDVLTERNSRLETRVEQLEERIHRLQDRVYELEHELQGYRRTDGQGG